MATQQVTFNKSNWSGETMTLAFDADALSFELHEYRFELVETFDDPETGKIFNIVGDAWPAGRLGMVYDVRGCSLPGEMSPAVEAFDEDMDMSRDGSGFDGVEALIVAAARLLCNLI